jgi:hypothetical protein
MAPTETKVKASTTAVAVSGLALWALQRYVFKDQDIPDVVVSWIYVLVPGALAWAAGYWAPHTHRPDLVPPQQQPVVLPERNSQVSSPVVVEEARPPGQVP